VVSKRVHAQLSSHDGYQAVQAIPGVGPVLAAVFGAGIGDVTRFPSPRQLASWAGLTPRHRESGTTVIRGPITKQGSRLVRWAAIEAVQRVPASAGWLVSTRSRLTEARGRNIATTAVARRLPALVFYGLRDGHIRALDHPQHRRTGTAAA
jgi:transposase